MLYHRQTKHHFFQVMGFADTAFQSLYHFSVGGPVEDPRLSTLPPYGVDR